MHLLCPYPLSAALAYSHAGSSGMSGCSGWRLGQFMIEQFDEMNVMRGSLGLAVHALMTLRTALRRGSNLARGMAQFAFHALETISSTDDVKSLYWVSLNPRFGCVMSVVVKWRRL